MNWVRHLAKSSNQAVLTAELLNALIERIEVDVDKTVTVTFNCRIGGTSMTKIALYLRLSVDEANTDESNSITHQR